MSKIPSRSQSSTVRPNGRPIPERTTNDVFVDGVWYKNQPVAPSHTPSVTPSITATPSITPSLTPSISRTPSVTPTVTPSITPTPSH